MKITDIETIFAHRYLFVRVHTDAGIIGLGECGNWGYLKACSTVIEHMKEYLIGKGSNESSLVHGLPSPIARI
jgi:galactonate dehydratase